MNCTCREWWGSLSDSGRWALIDSLYAVVSTGHEELSKQNKDVETKIRISTAEETVVRLTQILEAGEIRWENRFMEAQKEARERVRINADNSAQFRKSITILEEENMRLRSQIDAKKEENARRACVEASSVLKGRVYEDDMVEMISSTFPGAVYTDTRTTPHAGDGMLFDPEFGEHRCMFEFKSHTRPVREVEVAKLSRDLDSSQASFAIMLTRSVNVVGRRDFSIERTPTTGKPILFLVRTDDCASAVPSLLRQSLRFLTQLVCDKAASEAVDLSALAIRFTRTARTLRSTITKFDQQWAAMRTALVESIDELQTAVAPDLCIEELRVTLTAFDDRTAPVSVDEILKVIRVRHPTVTKRKLMRMLRQVGSDYCTIMVVKPKHKEWVELCGPNSKLKSASFVCFG